MVSRTSLRYSFRDLKVNEQAVITELFAGKKDFNSEIVSVKVLAFSLVSDEPVRSRE